MTSLSKPFLRRDWLALAVDWLPVGIGASQYTVQDNAARTRFNGPLRQAMTKHQVKSSSSY